MSGVIVVIVILLIIGLVRHTNKQRRLHRTYSKPIGTRNPPTWMKQRVYVRDNGQCRHCGVTEHQVRVKTGKAMEYDHIIPWSRGGPTTVNNLQLLCPYCNARKSNRFVG
jgi:5-methylcytosine-specific restriction endonuclease McrA